MAPRPKGHISAPSPSNGLTSSSAHATHGSQVCARVQSRAVWSLPRGWRTAVAFASVAPFRGAAVPRRQPAHQPLIAWRRLTATPRARHFPREFSFLLHYLRGDWHIWRGDLISQYGRERRPPSPSNTLLRDLACRARQGAEEGRDGTAQRWLADFSGCAENSSPVPFTEAGLCKIFW